MYQLPVTITKIVRSRRRTIGLEIQRDGSLVVRASFRSSLTRIQRAVRDELEWIIRTQERMRQRYQPFEPIRFVSGEHFWFLGKRLPLTVCETADAPLKFHDGFLLSQPHTAYARQLFLDWYHSQAENLILSRVDHLANQHHLPYRRASITMAHKRWGSCSHANTLNFSYRLVMAPLESIDYVILHELAHTVEKNHGPDFWALVRKLMPRFDEHKRWLSEHSHLLRI